MISEFALQKGRQPDDEEKEALSHSKDKLIKKHLDKISVPLSKFVNETTNKHIKAETHFEKGKEFFKNNDYQSAIDSYTKAIANKPKGDGSKHYKNRASAYFRLEKPSLAIDDCETALNLDQNCVKTLSRLSKSQLMLGDL